MLHSGVNLRLSLRRSLGLVQPIMDALMQWPHVRTTNPILSCNRWTAKKTPGLTSCKKLERSLMKNVRHVCYASLNFPSQLDDDVRASPDPTHGDPDSAPPSKVQSFASSLPSLKPALEAAQDWNELYLALVSTGTADALTVQDAVNCLRRATQLAADKGHAAGGQAGANDRLYARTVASLCCLILLRELDQLDMVTISGALGALGLLAAHGVLPPVTVRDAPREVLVAAAHLSHRARVAGASGRLGPNQLAHVLRGTSLLAPQMLGEEWLEQVEAQLGREVMGALAPASVAALMTAITKARQGRVRGWSPDRAWVVSLQESIAPRLEEFTGFELAATFYGLVDLTTTTSTPYTPHEDDKISSKQHSRETTTELPTEPKPQSGGLPFSLSMTKQQAMAARASLLRTEQQRIHGLWATKGGAAGAVDSNANDDAAKGPLHPELLKGVRGWEKSWATTQQWQHQAQQVAATVAATTPTATPTATANPPANSSSTTSTSSSSSILMQQATISVDIPSTPVFTRCACGVQVRSLAPSDLALMLVSYTRLGLVEFTPARPRDVGMLPFEVVAAEKEMGFKPSQDDDDDEEEEEEE